VGLPRRRLGRPDRQPGGAGATYPAAHPPRSRPRRCTWAQQRLTGPPSSPTTSPWGPRATPSSCSASPERGQGTATPLTCIALLYCTTVLHCCTAVRHYFITLPLCTTVIHYCSVTEVLFCITQFRTAALVYRWRAWGAGGDGHGVRWAFTPAVSVCQDARWGRCYESFSSNAAIVTPMSRSEVLGFQVRPQSQVTPCRVTNHALSHSFAVPVATSVLSLYAVLVAVSMSQYVLPVAAPVSLYVVPVPVSVSLYAVLVGGLPLAGPLQGSQVCLRDGQALRGDGGTAAGWTGQHPGQLGPHQGRARPPFASAIQSGVSSIMVSYSSVNGVPMHQNRSVQYLFSIV